MTANEASILNQLVDQLANAIFPQGATPAKDESGGHVASLTEAVMGITAGLFAVADAIKEHGSQQTIAEAIDNFSNELCAEHGGILKRIADTFEEHHFQDT